MKERIANLKEKWKNWQQNRKEIAELREKILKAGNMNQSELNSQIRKSKSRKNSNFAGEKSEKRTEKRVPKIMENVVETGESVPKIMEDVVEIEKDVPEISENVIETEAKVTHQIKLVAEFFDDAAAGRKSFELRKNDRNYKEGDVLEMEEVKDGKKTGRKCSKRIVYMMENFEGLEDGYCILGCELL